MGGTKRLASRVSASVWGAVKKPVVVSAAASGAVRENFGTADGMRAGEVLSPLTFVYKSEKDESPMIRKMAAAETREKLFQLAQASMPPKTDEPAVDAQGNLYYGADLGTIRVRKPGGEWGAIHTGSLRGVSAVELHGTTLVAGYVGGGIRVGKIDGSGWA